MINKKVKQRLESVISNKVGEQVKFGKQKFIRCDDIVSYPNGIQIHVVYYDCYFTTLSGGAIMFVKETNVYRYVDKYRGILVYTCKGKLTEDELRKWTMQ